jgi:hypothetical protein
MEKPAYDDCPAGQPERGSLRMVVFGAQRQIDLVAPGSYAGPQIGLPGSWRIPPSADGLCECACSPASLPSR